ncbi:hypothetical protein PCASD_09962 [Puccinia coronata f. sp. avenae]|uniref:Uncharacterized protein n=1 Tax=Puccinia coronata f. sp. avenae TaxID=200324 RepID=A0A2N5UUU6_9BASI|nr:hypothetical protein PCASD_09962 [Puccinia coronata f. sp. avenae]
MEYIATQALRKPPEKSLETETPKYSPQGGNNYNQIPSLFDRLLAILFFGLKKRSRIEYRKNIEAERGG